MGNYMKTMEETKVRTLTIQDRCDRCNAQAWVEVKGIEGTLLFCNHHFTKHEEALYNWAYEIVDEREYINQKSQSSA
jgi:hypothetical protein